MALISGCQEGKATPKLVEVRCPVCGNIVEVFVRLGAQDTGTLASDETCDSCGKVLSAGVHLDCFQKV